MRSKSLNLRVPRLGINRFGVYYVRSSSPGEAGHRKVTQQSLRTKDPRLAKLLALKFCSNLISEDLVADWRKFTQNYEINLTSGKVIANGHEDHMQALAMVKALQEGGGFENMLRRHLPSQAVADSSSADAAVHILLAQAQAGLPKPTNIGLKLTVALEAHLLEEARTLKSERTVNDKKILFKEFSDFFGDILLNQITQPDITNRWRISEFARENRKCIGKKLELSTLEKRRGFLRKFFEWAHDGGKYAHPVNPMSQKMAKKKEIRAMARPYKEFTTEDLGSLFSAKYREHMNKSDWYWAPLMSLYSGARKGEIANLQLDAFEVIDGIDVYFIPDAKTPEGRRTVPVHSMLLNLGLMDYARFLRTKGETHLFGLRPAMTRDKSVGREWGVWVDRCGIKDCGGLIKTDSPLGC